MKFLKWIFFLCAALSIIAYALNNQLKATPGEIPKSAKNYSDNRFHNTTPTETPDFGKFLGIVTRMLTEPAVDSEPTKPLPIQPLTRGQLDALDNQQIHLVKLGHSSILLKVYGNYWLFDPIFAERASPFQFAGPKRFHPNPITIDELPNIDKVFISHNHYDHLDKTAIQQLIPKTKQFLVPIGVDGDIKKWGADPSKVYPFDWWQELKTDDTLIAFTPSQHFSGRAIADRSNTLWGSWVVKTAKHNLYFSGDTGYFDGFKIIGEKYGPFDFTMIENGAYNRDWSEHHMTPEQSVQAHIDLRGKIMLPIHNSTFKLAFHPWYEPLDRIRVIGIRRKVPITTPMPGQIFTIDQQPITEQWWKGI